MGKLRVRGYIDISLFDFILRMQGSPLCLSSSALSAPAALFPFSAVPPIPP